MKYVAKLDYYENVLSALVSTGYPLVGSGPITGLYLRESVH